MRSVITCLFLVVGMMVTAHAVGDVGSTTPKTIDELRQSGKAVVPPKLISDIQPEFPEKLRKKKKAGTVVISFVVNEHGVPQQLQIKSTSDHGFDRVSLDAVRQWRFEPATVDGEPSAVITNTEITFRLY